MGGGPFFCQGIMSLAPRDQELTLKSLFLGTCDTPFFPYPSFSLEFEVKKVREGGSFVCSNNNSREMGRGDHLSEKKYSGVKNQVICL